MRVIVDTLASAYGWAKDDILDKVYLDEAWDYMRLIQRRKIAELKMLSSAYHSDPKELQAALDEETAKLTPTKEPEKAPELDKAGFAALKAAMSNNPRMQIK